MSSLRIEQNHTIQDLEQICSRFDRQRDQVLLAPSAAEYSLLWQCNEHTNLRKNQSRSQYKLFTSSTYRFKGIR